MPKPFPKPCLSCGRRTDGDSYCTEHKRVRVESPERRMKKAQRYDTTYHKLAKYIRLTATRCHLCGEGPRLNDPWEADHLFPDTPGHEYDLAPAHRSCNQRRGNKPLHA